MPETDTQESPGNLEPPDQLNLQEGMRLLGDAKILLKVSPPASQNGNFPVSLVFWRYATKAVVIPFDEYDRTKGPEIMLSLHDMEFSGFLKANRYKIAVSRAFAKQARLVVQIVRLGPDVDLFFNLRFGEYYGCSRPIPLTRLKEFLLIEEDG